MANRETRTHARRDGFALVVVILVTGIALLAFMFAATTLSVASRTSAARERASTQALLAADSGLRTLLARSTDQPYTSGTFAAWLAGSTVLRTLDLGDGVVANLEILDEDLTGTDPWVLVQSTGSVGTGLGAARRVLMQTFAVDAGAPVPLSVSAPAALVSVGSIISTSAAASVEGVDSTEESWIRSDALLCEAAVGEFVKLDGDPNLYRVVDVGDVDLTCAGRTFDLETLSGTDLSRSGGQTVDHMPFATTGSFGVNADNESLVPVTDATRTLFAADSSITIGLDADGNDSLGTVDEVVIDPETGAVSLAITWSNPPAASSRTAATVVRRSVSSGLTQGSCPYDNKGVLAPAFQENGCIDTADLTSLFLKTFGVTEEQLLSYEELNFVASGDLGSTALSGWNWYTPEQGDSNVRDQAGSGVLIIDARELSNGISLNVGNAFTGLIYVLGDADLAGNAQYTGTIIIDGAVSIKQNDGTSVAGTVDVDYDPFATSRALAALARPSEKPGRLGEPVAGTWRLR